MSPWLLLVLDSSVPRMWCGGKRYLVQRFVSEFIHHLSHIHAEYQGETAVYSLPDGELLAGAIPSKKEKLVVAWIEIHQEDLLADWELAVHGKQLFRIRGLDQ